MNRPDIELEAPANSVIHHQESVGGGLTTAISHDLDAECPLPVAWAPMCKHAPLSETITRAEAYAAMGIKEPDATAPPPSNDTTPDPNYVDATAEARAAWDRPKTTEGRLLAEIRDLLKEGRDNSVRREAEFKGARANVESRHRELIRALERIERVLRDGLHLL